jgi:hypothetical protein
MMRYVLVWICVSLACLTFADGANIVVSQELVGDYTLTVFEDAHAGNKTNNALQLLVQVSHENNAPPDDTRVTITVLKNHQRLLTDEASYAGKTSSGLTCIYSYYTFRHLLKETGVYEVKLELTGSLDSASKTFKVNVTPDTRWYQHDRWLSAIVLGIGLGGALLLFVPTRAFAQKHIAPRGDKEIRSL